MLGAIGYWCTAAVIRYFRTKDNTAKATENASQHKADHQQQGDWGKAHGNEQNERKTYAHEQNENSLWHKVLDVNPNASMHEIKIAYKKKISMYDPDKVSGLGPEFNEIAQRRSKEINTAYDEALKLKA